MQNAAQVIFFFDNQNVLDALKSELSDSIMNLNISIESDDVSESDEFKFRNDVFIKMHSDATFDEYTKLVKMLQNKLEKGEQEDSMCLVNYYYNGKYMC